MLRVSCKDIGIEGCDFACEGEKVGEVEGLMMEHLRDAHPHIIAGLDFQQHKALENRIKAGIHGLEAGGQPHELDKHLMLRASCSDLGLAGCDFVAEDMKVRRVEQKMFDHIRAEHPELVAGLSWKQHAELEHRVKAAIKHD